MPDIIAKVFSIEGKEVGQEKLPANIFAIDVKPEVVQQVVTAHQANTRQTLGHTKTRGEVRGGGRKPWKQKGTGRARHGSRRSPIWVGGGITFGPRKEQTFTKSVNKKMKKLAMKMVLSDKATHEKILLLDAIELPEAKTKKLAHLLNALPSKGKKAIIVTDATAENVIRAARNLPRATTIGAASLNVFDLLNYEYIVMPKAVIATIEKAYK